MADWVGQHIDDYRLIRLLGRGSFGEVYLGEHVDDQTLVAVKMLSLNEEKLSQKKLEEFVKEASTAHRLKHAHIISLLAFGMSADSIPYLVMDYAPNGTLSKRYPKGTRLSLDTIVGYLVPLAEALQYAHDRRVIHRDVKPENVLIGQDGRILLSDFGVAVMAPIERSLSTQSAGGTPVYMAPEQIGGKPQPASDQYALGILVYEWLCGVRPFQGSLWEILDQHRSQQPPSLCEKLPDLSPMVEEIIFKALAKKPQERFACVQDFATALQQAVHVEKRSSPVSSSSLSLAPLPTTDVSRQLGQASDRSAIPQSGPVPHSTSGPLVGTNPALSMTRTPAGSVPLSVASSSISSLHTQKLVFDSSMPPAIRRTPMSKKLVVFVGLILVMIGSSVFFSPAVINLLKNAPPTIEPQYGTATAVAASYGTAIAVTTTAQANIILTDILNQNIHNWIVGTYNNHSFAFKGGEYHIGNNSADHLAVALLPDEDVPEPFTYTITMNEVKGDDAITDATKLNLFGLVLRYNQKDQNNQTFYSFEIKPTNSNAEYQFRKYDSSQSDPWTMLWHQPLGSEYHPGQGAANRNTIKVVANGSNFTFLVNGKQVGSILDNAFQHGQIGMLVNQAGAEIAFSNLILTHS